MHFNAIHQLTQPVNDKPESLDDFANYLKTISTQRLGKVLNTMKDDVFQKWVRSSHDLSRLLDLLDLERCRIFCETTQPWMQCIINAVWIFNSIFEHLPPNKKTILYESYKSCLLDLIESDRDYESLARFFNAEQAIDFNHLFIIHKIKQDVSSSVASELNEALNNQDPVSIKAALHELIRGVNYRNRTLSYFFSRSKVSPEKLIEIISMMESGWITKINSALNLGLAPSQMVWRGDVSAALGRYVEEQSGIANTSSHYRWLICGGIL